MSCLMGDELAVEARVTINKDYDCVAGVCCEHSGEHDLRCFNVEIMRRLNDAIERGDATIRRPLALCASARHHFCPAQVHADRGDRMVKEALVISHALFDDVDYHAKPVLVIATCKAMHRGMQRSCIEAVEDVYDELDMSAKVGDLVSVYSDGDATRRQAFVDSETETIALDSPLGRKLEGLPLIDRAVAPKERTRGMDPKHIEKRERAIFKSATRGSVCGAVGGFKHTRATTKAIFVKCDVLSVDKAERVFTPLDDQSVPEAVACLRALLALPGAAAQIDLGADEKMRVADLTIWAEIAEGMLLIAHDLASDLSTILRKALKSSFVLLVAFRRHGTALCPSQLYHDFQRTVKDLVLLVAKVQVAVDAGTLHYSKLHCSQIGSDREENLFSDVRTITHDRSVDMSSLGERLSAAMQVREAFAALPHADRGSRRLGNQTDDRVNPKSTTGCRDVKRVDLRACYDGAAADAVAVLKSHGAYDTVTLADFRGDGAQFNLLKPHGVHVGVSLGTEELADDRDPENGTTAGEGAASDGAAAKGGSSLLEGVLHLTHKGDLASVDDVKNTVTIDGREVNKAAAAKIIFGRAGGNKSNDRLKRVRGVGRLAPVAGASLDRDADADMDAVVVPGDVGLITAGVLGGGLAVCLVVVERLDHGTLTGLDDLTHDELRESVAFLHVKRATTTTSGSALLYKGDVMSPSIKVAGADFTPIRYSTVDAEGQHFSLDELSVFAKETPGPDKGYRLRAMPQHELLQIEGSAAPTNEVTCAVCAMTFKEPRELRGHVAGHFFDGSLGDGAGIEFGFCGFCGGKMQGDACSTGAQFRSGRATKVSSNCPMFPGSKMSYKLAAKRTKTSPCTNVPILCKEVGCVERDVTFWKYCIAAHYSTAHPTLSATSDIVTIAKETRDTVTISESVLTKWKGLSSAHVAANLEAIAKDRADTLALFKKQKRPSRSQPALTTAPRAELDGGAAASPTEAPREDVPAEAPPEVAPVEEPVEAPVETPVEPPTPDAEPAAPAGVATQNVTKKRSTAEQPAQPSKRATNTLPKSRPPKKPSGKRSRPATDAAPPRARRARTKSATRPPAPAPTRPGLGPYERTQYKARKRSASRG